MPLKQYEQEIVTTFAAALQNRQNHDSSQSELINQLLSHHDKALQAVSERPKRKYVKRKDVERWQRNTDVEEPQKNVEEPHKNVEEPQKTTTDDEWKILYEPIPHPADQGKRDVYHEDEMDRAQRRVLNPFVESSCREEPVPGHKKRVLEPRRSAEPTPKSLRSGSPTPDLVSDHGSEVDEGYVERFIEDWWGLGERGVETVILSC